MDGAPSLLKVVKFWMTTVSKNVDERLLNRSKMHDPDPLDEWTDGSP